MKRRNFLKTIAGVFGAAAVGAKLAPAAPEFELIVSPTPVPPPYNFPRGLAYLVSQDTGCFQGLSRVSFPELKAPVTDAHGPVFTPADFERIGKMIKEKVR